MMDRLKIKSGYTPRDGFSQQVDRLTNHERNTWARRGYPGLQKHELGKMLEAVIDAHR